MARAALNWDVRTLARNARVGTATVTRFENNQVATIPATVEVMQHAFESAGITFIEHGVIYPPPGSETGAPESGKVLE